MLLVKIVTVSTPNQKMLLIKIVTQCHLHNGIKWDGTTVPASIFRVISDLEQHYDPRIMRQYSISAKIKRICQNLGSKVLARGHGFYFT